MKTIILSLLSVLILDSNTKEPLTGVKVTDVCTGTEYYTDLDGYVSIPDSCVLSVSFISYKDTTLQVDNSDCSIYLSEE